MSDALTRLAAALADRYQIERELGAGGMATVYLAQDLKHDRKVAIKVLKPELAAVLGADRFVQEIKTTANLQHPNILPLFDSGEADGFLYYVMPYIEGETLRGKLNREKQLSIDEAVKITTEVAEALDSAHRQDVIHRDIKPENILLHDGRPMVADFGIALAVSAAAGGRMTETGLSLGTPHYMSPEQATAEKDLTNRSDIYSLGAVLYEMLTGSPPHVGSSAQQIIMKIVTEEAQPVTKARKAVPPNVAAAVAKALERLAADRFESADAFAEALKNPHFTAPHVPSGGRGPKESRRVIAVFAALVALLGVVAVLGWVRPEAGPSNEVIKFTFPVPNGHVMNWGWRPQLAISPDGRSIAYFSDRKLYLRNLDSFAAEVRFEGDGDSPVFSDDGQWLGLRYENQMWKLRVSGGSATPIAGAANPGGTVDWSNDSILVSGGQGIFSIPAEGGSFIRVTTIDHDAGETQHSWPQRLSGDLLLFTVNGPSLGWDDARVVLEDLATHERIVVMEQATYGRYVPSGHVLFVRENGALFALPFDLKRRRPTGDAVPILEGLRLGADIGAASFAVSANGTAVFVQGVAQELGMFRWWNHDGQDVGALGQPMSTDQPEISPDGSRVAATVRQRDNDDVWIVNTRDGAQQRITFDLAEEETPVWSPDGARLAYSAYSQGRERQILVKTLDSPEPAQVVFRNERHVHVTSWSPDGQWLATAMPEAETRNDIWLLQLGDSTRAIPFLTTEANESDPRFSPDGRWIAYTSDESQGEPQIFVSRWPEARERFQVSRSGGNNPRWSRDGRTLYYWREEGTGAALYAVPITASLQRFAYGAERKLFDAPLAAAYAYDVRPDGQGFLLGLANPDAVAYEIHVIVNFFEEVQQKVGN